MATWNSDKARSEGAQVLQWLFDEALKLKPDGSVAVPGFGEPNTAAAVLSSRLGFNKHISARQRFAIARRAVIDAVKQGKTTVDGLLQIVTAMETQHLAEPLKPFVLLTSVSASDLYDMPTVRLGPATITFSRYPPRRFKTPQLAVRHRWSEKRFWQRTPVRVHVRARTPQDAFDSALRQLDLLRAFWNLGLNRGTWRLSLGGGFRPVNDIRLGPIHTLHHVDGRPALEAFWYEPAFQSSETVSSLGSQKLEQCKAEETWCRTRIRRFKKAVVIEDLFVRYCRALDQADETNAFLQTWAILETLTGNPSSYSDLVQRASYLYTDRWYARLQLKDMQQIRNDLVHSGRENDRLDELLYRLKQFVEHYLVFLLRNHHALQNLDELRAFLSQPTELSALKKRRESVALAERIFRNM